MNFAKATAHQHQGRSPYHKGGTSANPSKPANSRPIEEVLFARIEAEINDSSAGRSRRIQELAEKLNPKNSRHQNFARIQLRHLLHQDNPGIVPLLIFLAKNPSKADSMLAVELMFSRREYDITHAAATVIKKGFRLLPKGYKKQLGKLSPVKVGGKFMHTVMDAIIITEISDSLREVSRNKLKNIFRAIKMRFHDSEYIRNINDCVDHIFSSRRRGSPPRP